MTTPTMTRTMPTEGDVPEIWTIAQACSGSDMVRTVTATSGGVLIRYNHRYATSPAPALQAVGYSTSTIREGLVLVTGAVDELALLDAQIAALTARRQALAAQRQNTAAQAEAGAGAP